MARKLTYEEVKHFIEVESGSGCKLLSEEYKNNHTPLLIKCKCGKVFERCWMTIKARNLFYCHECTSSKIDWDINKVREYVLSHSNSILLSNIYKNMNEKLKFRCECGEIFYRTFSNFKKSKNSTKCTKCSLKSRSEKQKLSHEEFLKKLPQSIKNEYEILTKYKNHSQKIKVKHNICKYVWETNPSTIIKGHGCPKCAGNIKKSKEDFVKELYDLVGEEYTLVGEYINANKKTIIKHNICGYLWNVTPSNILRGRRCPKCRGMYMSEDEFKEKLKKLGNGEYELVSDFVNKKTKVKLRHINCNHVWEVVPTYFLQGTRCPKCQHRSYKKTTEEFKQEVYNLVGDEYTVLGNYVNIKTKIKMRHNVCGNEWLIKPNNFLINGRRCPICSTSKGEKKIKDYLDNTKIKYKYEYYNNECKDIYPLRFDFKIEKIMIEYDGLQHFEQVDSWGGIKKLKDRIKKDKIKNQYCIDNNIPLIRIPYWEYDNIEYILKNVLMHFDLIEKDDTYDESVVKKYLVDKNWVHDKYIEMNKNYK